ncbi:hypothetical protein [Thermogymnomonas acidicola]|nr:hypothetical protein [Thermogymnomonas acidicola]
MPRDLGFWTSVLPLFMGMSSEERAREFASSGYLRISGDGGASLCRLEVQ